MARTDVKAECVTELLKESGRYRPDLDQRLEIDLNPEYLELAQRRIGPMLCEVIMRHRYVQPMCQYANHERLTVNK